MVIATLDWRDPSRLAQYDDILGADVVYERRDFHPVIALLQKALRQGGRAIFTEPDRSVGSDFFALAAACGFAVQSTVLPVTLDGRVHAIRRCVLTRAGGDA